MKPGEYIVIKVADIEEKIKMLDDAIKSKKFNVQNTCNMIGGIVALSDILSNPKDLYDVIEDSFYAGRLEEENTPIISTGLQYELAKDYLKNLEI